VQLFRPEALRGQDRLHGDVVLVPPVSWQLLGYLLFAALVVGAAFLVTASHTSTAPATGRLVGDAGQGLAAELEIPADAAAYVADGQTVRLAVAAYPEAGWAALTGRIEDVSAEPPAGRGGGDALIAHVRLDQSTLRSLAGRRTLRAGMTVRARIATRSRTLGEWLLAPLRSGTR
jgi:membrane fusion protein